MTVPSVLIVSPIASHPADQGNAARIRAEADELSRRGIALDFLYYGMEGITQSQFDAMTKYWRRFFFLPSLALPSPSLPHAWGVDDWCSERLCERTAEIVKQHRYDAIIVNYVWMSKVLDGIDGPLKIIDTHDLFGDRNKVAEGARLEPRWFFTTREEENRAFARADIVIGIQREESHRIEDRHGGTTITVGHPIDPHFLLDGKTRGMPPFTFGYLGSGNPFNVASIAALDRTIAQSGRTGATSTSWTVAGTISKRLPALVSHPYRMGVIGKLSDFYDNVECVLNPMVGGTGLKIKTIEALAYGRPIIGTADAFEGVEAAHPLHRLEGVEEVADAMRQYQASEALRTELQKESYRVFATYMAQVSSEYDRLAEMIRGVDAPRLALSA